MASRTKQNGPLTVVVATSVAPSQGGAYAEWQDRITGAAATFPGFLGSETQPPKPPEQPDWVTTYRFDTLEHLTDWLESDVRDQLRTEAEQFRLSEETVRVFTGTDAHRSEHGLEVTSILYWQVPADHSRDFERWHESYAQVMGAAPGFTGYQLQKPLKGMQDEWVEVVRWESAARRDEWIRSEGRQRMLELGEGLFESYQVRNVRTSFEGWFRFDSSTAGSPTPTWKQSMVVLLILYPTVFLLTVYVTNPLEWPLWAGLFLGNVLSVSLMGFVITPLVMRYVLGWWLNPPPTASKRRMWCGVGIITVLYLLFLALFSGWPV